MSPVYALVGSIYYLSGGDRDANDVWARVSAKGRV